jgi:hypothetical protein
MTDDELRKLVRDAIARHLGHPVGSPVATSHGTAHGPGEMSPTPLWRTHASFGKFLELRNDASDMCMIEPTVQCNHCGFCQSYGH